MSPENSLNAIGDPFAPRVVMVSPVHISSDIRIFHKEASSLARAGYEVVLFARHAKPEVVNGIHIVPVRASAMRFMRFLRLLALVWDVLRCRGAIYHLHNPDTLPIAFILKLFGRRVIYDTHEDFSKRILIRQWIPRWARPLLARLVTVGELFGSYYFDATIVTQEEVRCKYGPRAVVIDNKPISRGPLVDSGYDAADEMMNNESFRLVYAGAISYERGIDIMLEAVRRANDITPVRLVLMGKISSDVNLRDIERIPGWQYVDYLGHLSQECAFAEIAKCHLGLVLIRDIGDHAQTSANKLYEYQLFGVPFLASDFPKWHAELGDINSGLFVDQTNIEQVTRCILWFAQHRTEATEMGKRGRRYIQQQCNWENESTKLLQLYARLMQNTFVA